MDGEDPDQTAWMSRLVLAFAVGLCPAGSYLRLSKLAAPTHGTQH